MEVTLICLCIRLWGVHLLTTRKLCFSWIELSFVNLWMLPNYFSPKLCLFVYTSVCLSVCLSIHLFFFLLHCFCYCRGGNLHKNFQLKPKIIHSYDTTTTTKTTLSHENTKTHTQQQILWHIYNNTNSTTYVHMLLLRKSNSNKMYDIVSMANWKPNQNFKG